MCLELGDQIVSGPFLGTNLGGLAKGIERPLGSSLGSRDRALGKKRGIAETVEVGGQIEIGVGAIEVYRPTLISIVDVALAQERRHGADRKQQEAREQRRLDGLP